MKIAPIAIAFATFLFAQSSRAQLPQSCGPKGSGFNIELDSTQHSVRQPAPGKAQVYFIQDVGPPNWLYAYVINVGLDGAWAGANKNNSYFSVSVEPGEHHVCENVKSRFSVYGRLVEATDFAAEAGKIYYFRARLTFGEAAPSLELGPVDADEAKYLIGSDPLSVSRPKK
jgi:Protein of unknown function (DUF2846)